MMGTYIEATAYGRHATAALDQVFSRLKQIEQQMTINQPNSQITAVNAAAGQRPVQVSDDTFLVVQRALEYAHITGGKFDPTVQPIVSLWKIGTPEARVPAPSEISAKLPLVVYQAVQLDEQQHTVFLPQAGMGLDLGGIAKGYAADQAVEILRASGVKNALLSLGGNVYALGTNPDGKPWRIGIQDPENARNTYLAIIETSNETLVTSGAYERYLDVDGQRYHHIIDPGTGYPAETDVLSSTIVTTNSMDADALSTSVLILGREKGLELIEQLTGIEAVVIDKQHKIYLTSGMKNRVKVTDDLYQLVP
jgi:thiamine biosynthesis lipoprotein